MKLLSVTIPCYNSADYMEKCIKQLLDGGDEVEIIIVDDGSTKDNTAQIADDYATRYPNIVKAVHQENGGHGEAVNTGLLNATGKFFKVVDSDDWVDPKSYQKVLDTLRRLDEEARNGGTMLDMLVCNYVYEKVGASHKKVIHYKNVFPQDRMFTWDEIGHFKLDQYILMHSVIYRTDLLKECGLKLPKHTFYVDNIFVFEPLPSVKNMYYLNTNFYRYYIGREDQSVNEQIMIKRIDQQIRVTQIMVDYFRFDITDNKKCLNYMIKYLRIMMEISSIMLIISKDKELLLKKKELWKYVKEKDPKLYRKLRYSVLGWTVNLPGSIGRRISSTGYRVMNKIIGFN